MKKIGLAIAITAGAVLAASPAFAQNHQGPGRAVGTIVPSHHNANIGQIPTQGLKLKVNGKDSVATNFAPIQNADSPVELVLLIDGGIRTSLGTEFREIETFVKEMPPNTKMAIAYMENGRAVLASPLSSNGADVLKGLHLSAGFPGSNASPYFCLSDLAKNWPSHDRTARREVLMVTDGVDNYDRP